MIHPNRPSADWTASREHASFSIRRRIWPLLPQACRESSKRRGAQSLTPISGQGKDRGTVTAEFAVTLPAVVFLLALLLAGSVAGITQLRLEEAARAGARALARGDNSVAVDNIVRRIAGDGAQSSIVSEGEWLRLSVTAPVAGPLARIIPWTLTASASARTESPQAAHKLVPDGFLVAWGRWPPQLRGRNARRNVSQDSRSDRYRRERNHREGNLEDVA